MINQVLIPLDGSHSAEIALAAIKQVLRTDGRVFLMTALSVPPQQAEKVPHNHDGNIAAYMQRIAKNLQLQGYHVEVEIVQGHPAEVILKLAEEHLVDMIIMSTHGRSGLSRVLFGSVTLKVLENALMPVLVVPNRERAEARDKAENTAIDPGLAI
jgi:nucleotide-binding universal stress UspA family protein